MDCTYDRAVSLIVLMFERWADLDAEVDGAMVGEDTDRRALRTLMDEEEVAYHRMDACLQLVSGMYRVARNEVYADVVTRACTRLPEPHIQA